MSLETRLVGYIPHISRPNSPNWRSSCLRLHPPPSNGTRTTYHSPGDRFSIYIMDRLGPNLCLFSQSSNTRARCTDTRETFIYCKYAYLQFAAGIAHVYQVLQLFSWTSRVVSSALLALSYSRPNQDYLHLLHHPPSSRSRVYFSVLLALELSVSSFSIRLPQVRTESCQDFLLFMCCTAVAATSVHSTTRYDYQQISTRPSLHTLTKHEYTLVPGTTTCY